MQPLGRPPPPPPPPRHLILPLPRLHQCLRRKYATGGLALSFPDSAMPLLYPPLMQKPHDLPLLLAISSDANRRVRRLHATHPRRRRHHLLVQFEYELLPDDLFAVCNWSATHELHTWVLFQSTPSRRWLVRCDVDMEVLCSELHLEVIIILSDKQKEGQSNSIANFTNKWSTKKSQCVVQAGLFVINAPPWLLWLVAPHPVFQLKVMKGFLMISVASIFSVLWKTKNKSCFQCVRPRDPTTVVLYVCRF